MDCDEILDTYYGRNGKRLHYLVDGILQKFGGIAGSDTDDFYSLANEVFTEVLNRYDDSKDFEKFLYCCLANRIKTEMTRRNRIKRIIDREAVSIEALMTEEEYITTGGVTGYNSDMESEVYGNQEGFMEERIEKYLGSLSQLQRRILTLKMNGYRKKEILHELDMTEKIYDKNFEQIKSYDKTNILFEYRTDTNDKEKETMTAYTSEISKYTNFSVDSYIRKLKNYSIRGDHPLQRNSGQWNNLQKHNLITTVLNQYPIPEVILAEQIKSNGTMNWLIDGKQRLTNLLEYREGIFKVGRNAERPVIHYQTIRKDATGTVIFDKNGSPMYENREFDVRGKYYDDLPEELKERYNEYTISAVQYLSCSDDDLEFHIRRYNAAKPMSAAQKGITHLGEQYAGVVKEITRHPFFKDKGNFKISEFSNGTIDRVVTESIMAIHFLNDWKKKQEDICAFLKVNADSMHFEKFRELLDRLSETVTNEVADMFNSKDAFLWFGLFDRFIKVNENDETFVMFMTAFKDSLHGKTVGGTSYDDLCKRGTKDKLAVINKLTIMENLMNCFIQNRGEQ